MKTDRTIITVNNQEFGQIADPNKLEAQIVHAYDVIDSNDTEFQNYKTLLASTTDGNSGADNVKATAIAGLTGATVQTLLESLKALDDSNKEYLLSQIQGVTLGQIPDGTITPVKLSADSKKASIIMVEDINSHFVGTNVEEVLEELFTFANNGKESIATVVGSPATTGDTFAQLQTHIQNSKNALATNLANKGQPSVGTETLQALVDKVANVNTGKKFATGTATSSSTSSTYTFIDGTTIGAYSLSVTGLPFKPTFIYAFWESGGSVGIVEYSELAGDIYPKPVKITGANFTTSGTSSAVTRHIKGDVSPANISDTSFTLPTLGQSILHTWIALEI
ncbi:hypothetical protein SAMN05877753_10215 [Bacillus oleivorans]|uniref:Uncharacterized protein n=1 Tax=Bacillus oleivorans TaxID=1448271 RepID=A0A285CJN6_9BACI|nr:hypothetical protein [Bacillus oleivorans]SNX67811.1 hypothetical protein SAMN05877753_10215 [Bacillus oleivorans]